MFLNPTGADFGLPCAHQCRAGPPLPRIPPWAERQLALSSQFVQVL